MKVIKQFVWKILNVLGIGGTVHLHLQSGLKDDGWFVSFKKKQAVDKNNQPLPWYTYSFIKFLEPRLNKNLNVFEYGCGNSTRWYAQLTQKVTSVEHNKTWFDKIKGQLPDNASVLFKTLKDGESYERAVAQNNMLYHLIVVDGRKRNKSVKQSIEWLTNDGVLILDNSERDAYQESFDLLKAKGFKHISFWGMLPIVAHNSCSTIFYRPGNCLDI
ncbi:FkbM family methyltransferase [uncultured Microscilla sp.]|uniref:FkbM family methyltransferase n=1 Tax=uncultured Microscilla sp. TaxID=432653 RepID=UPI00260F3B9E|nr:FkbM family methyltransferase [uncultured Microscilla sp.]